MYPIPAISQKSVLWCHLSSRYGTRSTPRTHPLPGDTRRQDCKPGTCWNIDRDAWNAVWEFENIQQSFLYFHFLFFTFLLVLVPSPPSLQVCELTMLLTACISPSVTRVSSSTFVLPDSSQLLFSFSILKACFFFFFFFPLPLRSEKRKSCVLLPCQKRTVFPVARECVYFLAAEIGLHASSGVKNER